MSNGNNVSDNRAPFGPVVLSASSWDQLTDCVERLLSQMGEGWKAIDAVYSPRQPEVSFYLSRPVLH